MPAAFHIALADFKRKGKAFSVRCLAGTSEGRDIRAHDMGRQDFSRLGYSAERACGALRFSFCSRAPLPRRSRSRRLSLAQALGNYGNAAVAVPASSRCDVWRP
jgi:hypothetical protein